MKSKKEAPERLEPIQGANTFTCFQCVIEQYKDIKSFGNAQIHNVKSVGQIIDENFSNLLNHKMK